MKHQIFVVEDHPMMRDAYSLTIGSEADLSVCGTATTGEEALNSIDGFRPDLVLVDISLPGMSGIEFLKQLRERHPDLPALIISGHDRDLYNNSSLPNARGYVMKHEGPDVLLAAIRKIMAGEAAKEQ